jgi:hypothetical protein
MAIFERNNQSLEYRLSPAPFAADLVLIQGTRMTPQVWADVLADYAEEPVAGGRILTLELVTDAEMLAIFLQTLGLYRVHVVAADDAVAVVEAAQRQHSDLFAKTLFYAGGLPKGQALVEAIRVFCPSSPRDA